jgi:hypothetical protein
MIGLLIVTFCNLYVWRSSWFRSWSCTVYHLHNSSQHLSSLNLDLPIIICMLHDDTQLFISFTCVEFLPDISVLEKTIYCWNLLHRCLQVSSCLISPLPISCLWKVDIPSVFVQSDVNLSLVPSARILGSQYSFKLSLSEHLASITESFTCHVRD